MGGWMRFLGNGLSSRMYTHGVMETWRWRRNIDQKFDELPSLDRWRWESNRDLYRNALLDPQPATKKAVSVIGYDYDLTSEIRLTGFKPGPSGSSLIEVNETLTKDLVFPGGVVVPM
ncbi:hypothetical protein L1887_38806 [Cichorium endivia]|nr:hypothetical protein L1887_38806 [Cichorium endivia]